MPLTDLCAYASDVDFDIAYATPNNFTGKPVYARPAAYLLTEALPLLERAIGLARPQGFRLKIFDAFRPSEAQWVLWNHTPDPDFLADPRRGSAHSRGAALDLTLIDAASGHELDMGTPFDAFTPLSHHANLDISPEAQRNRLIFLGLMSAAGWDFYSKEWWHYQMFDPKRFPVLEDKVLGLGMMG
ncbi:MAG: D-alanyl-D-alanine dipeptidase [Alphaproteobacteria bacterium]|nr:D-alanyl-D-alanine dipeptidase [Alphaproteobacteria bacterium]